MDGISSISCLKGDKMISTENYIETLISLVLESLLRHGGGTCLSSVILTGSFGRDEPTLVTTAEGGYELKSDVEIALVFPATVKKRRVQRLINRVSHEFKEDLNLLPICESRVRRICNYNMSIFPPKYKTIFTFDLFNGSRTIWGRDFIGTRSVGLEEVDPYEAKKLIANRIGELIYLQSVADNEAQKNAAKMQWKGKLMLAIASAFLICEGGYVSSYHGQWQVLREVKDAANATLGTDFVAEYEKVFCYLRDNGEPYEVKDELLRGYVKRINTYFQKRNIRASRVNTMARRIKRSLKYVKTGMRYGVSNYEDTILQTLIDEYCLEDCNIKTTAQAWHRVLY